MARIFEFLEFYSPFSCVGQYFLGDPVDLLRRSGPAIRFRISGSARSPFFPAWKKFV